MEQLSLDMGRIRGDLGIERAARKADKVCAEWMDAALGRLRYFASVACTDTEPNFTMEEAREFVEALEPRPAGIDCRVWGAIQREAVRRGYIERVPNVYRAAASSNGSPKACYRRGAKA